MMRWLLLMALISCKTERVAPSLPPTETVGAADLTFWKWFGAHAAQVATIKDGSEPIMNELGDELHKIDADLAFELGVGKSGPKEMIVSADGKKALFPVVKRVVDAAPAIPGWKVIAFRPRKDAGTAIQLGGQKVGPEDLWFEVLPTAHKPGPIDVAIYGAGFDGPNDRAFKQATFILLDALLGEYDTEMRLGEIQFRSLAKKPAGARKLGELPALVDGWK
jgi:hypothetical protein